MRLMISTGLGRLHFIQAAATLYAHGVDVRVITGWTPRHTPDWLINAMGRLVGRTQLAYGMRKRLAGDLPDDRVLPCSSPEFAQQAMAILARAGLMNRAKARAAAWRMFGRASRRRLQDVDVLQVRSGAGQGGFIDAARARGVLTLADQSIAHPAIIERNVGPACRRHGQPLDIHPDDPFWSLVLQDCKDADHMIVNSQFVKDTFTEMGFQADRIHVVYFGHRTDFIGLKQDWGRGPTLRLLFTGSFNLRKGADVLLEALDQAVQQGLAVQLDVIGVADAHVPIPERLRDSGALRLHGYMPQDQLAGFLRDCDLYVFPSRAEGAAQSAMEAMSAGLPVVATHETGTPIRHLENGCLIPRDDPAALVEAIRRLADDQALREKIGRAGADDVRDHYTWTHYAQNMIDLLSKLRSSPAANAAPAA